METIKTTVMGERRDTPRGSSLLEISKDYQRMFKRPIILAKVDNELQELGNAVTRPCDIEFLDISDPNGFRIYQRSAVFLMLYAAKAVLGEKTRVVVEHSINKNYYCSIPDEDIDITEELLESIELKMRDTVDGNTPIEKFSISVEYAMELAKRFNLQDKADYMLYRRTSNVNFYRLDWFWDYFYAPMAPSAGYITQFKLRPKNSGFLLLFPSPSNLDAIGEIALVDKVFQIFRESNKWARILEVGNVGSLNNAICDNKLDNLILVSEALHEKKTANIADNICADSKKVVFIAGPSSSGKTTFAQRLCVQLRVNGFKPSMISLDNYFLGPAEAPLDEFGKPNFESVDAIDVETINAHLKALIAGERVEMPTFNFLTGSREYKGKFLQLGENDILVIEGIHALNSRVNGQIDDKDKFKIFISALTQLNMDDHNYISTTDTRLIRRIVRDSRRRGFDSRTTLSVWPSVVRGETQFIFPYQKEADVFFNSALIYEMCILKHYAEPHLFQINRSWPEYTEARRLVKFLDSFLSVDSHQVPTNSILREFIGGSCFE
ncbi:MAG: nucleoside kinase [Clostridiales bacterium]|nr:nucleoside kinase [Clostridiales bacterium]